MSPSGSPMAEASAPASSANLGPGFDCVAIALDLRCGVEAEPAAEWSVDHVGAHRPEPGSKDAVLAAARLALGRKPAPAHGGQPDPDRRGLGSSSAAMAAGALAAWRAMDVDPSLETVFDLVAEMDGHPDNAAAAVYGGFVIADAHGRVHRLPWNPIFAPIALIPFDTFSTTEARSVLPPTYLRSTVVASVARMASLVAGLLSGDPDLLRSAGGDEIHEGPRGSHRPEVARRIRAALDAGAVHAAWSGAGPTVLAIVEANRRDRVCGTLREGLAGEVSVECLDVASTGVGVTEPARKPSLWLLGGSRSNRVRRGRV